MTLMGSRRIVGSWSILSDALAKVRHTLSSPNATLIRSRRQFFYKRFFGTQLFLFLFECFEEIGYQKTSGEKIASRPD